MLEGNGDVEAVGEGVSVFVGVGVFLFSLSLLAELLASSVVSHEDSVNIAPAQQQRNSPATTTPTMISTVFLLLLPAGGALFTTGCPCTGSAAWA